MNNYNERDAAYLRRLPKNVRVEVVSDPMTNDVRLTVERGFRGMRRDVSPFDIQPLDSLYSLAAELHEHLDVGPECAHGARITYPCVECQTQ